MSIHLSETLLRRYLINSMETMHRLMENGSDELKLTSAAELAQLVLDIHKLNEEIEERHSWEENPNDDEGESWR